LQSAGVFLDALAAFVEHVPIQCLWRPQLHDPADELVLETAVNAAADALLSFQALTASANAMA
jgi:predicted nucleic acid-binding protein